MTKSDDISAVLQSRPLGDESEIRGYASSSKDLSQYFLRGKNMDPIEKIDGNISTYTRPLGASKRYDEITELSKNDTDISPKVSEGTNINEISEDIISQSQGSKSHCSAIEIPNMSPYLAQPENNMSSLIGSNSQIPIAYMF